MSSRKNFRRPRQIPYVFLSFLSLTALVLIGIGVWQLLAPDDGIRSASNNEDTEVSSGVVPTVSTPIFEENGVKKTASVVDGQLAVYDGSGWKKSFWPGINLGATTPGHYPGELSPTKEDYLRWFPHMKEMNIKALRIYTILPPFFYEALAEFNATQDEPLMLMQGVWSPEEELIGEDGNGTDAFTDTIKESFEQEIRDIVAVVNGQADLPEKSGHASGRYTADVSPYLLGWIVGTEWYPAAVVATNEANTEMKPYTGEYFRSTAQASPFESWLAEMLDVLAKEEMRYGWQHPVSFTNWVTTDPLDHPNEPLAQEDLVPVDPMHVEPTTNWTAGYFAAYHVYPYYPDSLRRDQKYLDYVNDKGVNDPYAGYLNELREHHKGIPLIIAEFGMPSSRGIAHFGLLGRHQGMHTEQEQGELNAGMLKQIYNEHYDGALLFEWQDEWFKFTWNTIEWELPGERRALWRNRLTNEEHFGVIALEPEENPEDLMTIDGKTDDWEKRGLTSEDIGGGIKMAITHDSSDLYILLQKEDGNWNFKKDILTLGFNTTTGGSTKADIAPGIKFKDGQEFVARFENGKGGRLYVNSAYDQFTWQYGYKLNSVPYKPEYANAEAGIYLPWKLALNRELYLPETKVETPFEAFNVGKLHWGTNDPDSERFNNLSDWYLQGDTLEIRIPWMLLGFTDPSSLKVWDYLYKNDTITPIDSNGVSVSAVLSSASDSAASRSVTPSSRLYTWDGWDLPAYHEREKKSYAILKEAFAKYNKPVKGSN
ncbi:hypothetical protein [Saccharibacillus kuerlensis]|uniref:Family 2 glycosyl transferase n=1 Tax=Saccharibacillus kuerlensis TaxID=459527 RepID=A0ABQ2KVA6_9BACL|nr:hypothetical protein [Saccharibacillus kuerlensis]GGN93638.1 hypothetical protein GCM10010969_07610 [Saccharibacillus kuerlensis]